VVGSHPEVDKIPFVFSSFQKKNADEKWKGAREAKIALSREEVAARREME